MATSLKMFGSIDEIKAILGEIRKKQYEELKDFFKHVLESERTKVIFSGRTYILYKIFESILEEEGCVKKGNTYTTDAISQIPKLEGELLIVEDIIINGFALDSIIQKIISHNIVKEDNIKVWCFRIYQNCMMYYKFKKYLGHRIATTSTEYKMAEQNLNEVVTYANVGNSSFVNSYRVNSDKLEPFLKESEYICENSHIFYTRSKIITEDFLPNDVVNSYNVKAYIRCCMRMSKNSYHTYQVMPYVFLPQLKGDKAYEYCKSLLSKLDLEYPSYFDENVDIELFYKWTIAAVSKKALTTFMEKAEVKLEDCDIFDCCEETFGLGDNVTLVKAEHFEVDSEAIFKDSANILSNFAYGMFKRYLLSEKDLTVVLNTYVDFMRKEETELAYMKRVFNSSNNGLRINAIFDEIETINTDELICKIIEFLTHNKLVCLIEKESVDSENIIIGEVFRCGSESFRVHYQEIYKNAAVAFKILFDKKLELRKSKLIEFGAYLDAIYETSEFSKFAMFLVIPEYYSDMISVIIKREEATLPFIEKNVDAYIKTYYKN